MASRALPRWQRVQRAQGAADYAGYRNEREFLAAVQAGEMPPPFLHTGAPAWDIVDIDASIEAMKAGAQSKRKWQERAPDRV